MRREDFRLLIVVMVFLALLVVWAWPEGALVGAVAGSLFQVDRSWPSRILRADECNVAGMRELRGYRGPRQVHQADCSNFLCPAHSGRHGGRCTF
jgi:hypothetical protein